MKQTLLNLLSKAKFLALKVYQSAPLLSGVILGYIFKPELKMIMDAGVDLIKGLLKLL